MAFTYRLGVYDATSNAFKDYLYTGEPISSIDYWTVEGNGNCVEANIKAKVIALSTVINARDIMQLQTSDDGVNWRDHFKGYVVRNGARRNNTRLSDIKLLGLKQRFYELVLTDLVIDGADVAQMVRDVVSQAQFRPAGVNTVASTASALIPDTSFSLADRYPNLETVGEFLDAMAATITGATWGVNASGDFFFLVAPQTQNVLTEGEGVFVNWEEPDATDVIDRVTLILADKQFPEDGVGNVIKKFGFVYFYANNYIPYPISHSYDSGAGYNAEKIELIPWSDAWLTEINRGVGEGVQGQSFANFANVYDQDPDTYAELTGATGFIESIPTSLLTEQIVSLNVRYSSTESAEIKVVIRNGDASDGVIGSEVIFQLPNTEGAIVNQDLIAPISATYTGATNANSWRFDVKNNAHSGVVRIYEITTYGLNTTILDDIAQAYLKLPVADVGSIKIIGFLVDASTNVDLTLTLNSADEIRVPTEFFTYRITKDGLETEIRVGQKFVADDLAINKFEKDRLATNKIQAIKFRK